MTLCLIWWTSPSSQGQVHLKIHLISLSCCFSKDISRFSVIFTQLPISSCTYMWSDLTSPPTTTTLFFFDASIFIFWLHSPFHHRALPTNVPGWNRCRVPDVSFCYAKKWVCKAEAETTPLILTTGHLRPAKIMTLKCLAFSWVNGTNLFPTIKACAFHIFNLFHTKRKTTHYL